MPPPPPRVEQEKPSTWILLKLGAKRFKKNLPPNGWVNKNGDLYHGIESIKKSLKKNTSKVYKNQIFFGFCRRF